MAAGFRATLNLAIDGLEKENPGNPQRYWDGLRRLASTEKYVQAAVSLFAADLSLVELQEINGVMCDPVKFVVLSEMIAVPKDSEPREARRYLDQLRAKHGKDVVDDVLEYGLGPLPKRLTDSAAKLSAQEASIAEQALKEAHKKLQASRG